jgi:hypothetical protein
MPIGARSWLRLAIGFGVAMLVLSIVLELTFPRAMGPLPRGSRTPILALELARSSNEIETMFGRAGSAERAAWVAAVDRGHFFDFAFLVAYNGFLFAAAAAFGSQRRALARLAMGLAVLVALADATENLCLLQVTAHLGGDYAAALSGLMVVTWVKWLAGAACLATFLPALRARGGWAALAGWLASLPLPLAIASVALRGVIAELMLLAMTLGFAALLIEAVRQLRPSAAAHFE